jgi:hypothetical protein
MSDAHHRPHGFGFRRTSGLGRRGILFKRRVAMHFGAVVGSVLDEIGQAANTAMQRTGVTTRR